MWSNIATWEKAHANRTRLLNKFRLWLARSKAKFDNFLCPSTPSLNQTSLIEHIRYEGIARARLVIMFEVFYLQSEGKRPSTPNLQPIVVDRQTNSTTRLRVIAMTDGIHQSFAKRNQGE